MVLSCSTCQKEEKECTWVKYLIYAVFAQSKIYCNLHLHLHLHLHFSAKSVFPNVHKKMFFFFPRLELGQWTVELGQWTVELGQQIYLRFETNKALACTWIPKRILAGLLAPSQALVVCKAQLWPNEGKWSKWYGLEMVMDPQEKPGPVIYSQACLGDCYGGDPIWPNKHGHLLAPSLQQHIWLGSE